MEDRSFNSKTISSQRKEAKSTMSISISTYQDTICLHCKRCGKVIPFTIKSIRDAYKKINNFRGDHEHLESLRRKTWRRR